MRAFFALSSILLLSFNSFAQKAKFTESFSKNNNGWLVYKGRQVSCNLQKGSYSIRNGSAQGIQIRTPYFLNSGNEFFLNTDVTVKGKASAKNGFYLNIDSMSYQFLFTREKKAYIVKKNLSSGAADTLFEKDRVKKIKDEDLESNNLGIKAKGGKIFFTINKGKVGSIDLSLKRITEMGYQLAPQNDLRVESFSAGNKPSIKRITLVNDTNVLNAERSTALGTEADEEQPVISADGKYLFFTSQYRSESVNMESGKRSKDIYYSVRRPDGSWTDAVRAGDAVNNEFDNTVLAVSADNNTLLLSGQYKKPRSTEFYDASLFLSSKALNGMWNPPTPIYIISSYAASAVSYKGFSLSASGKVLVLSAKRDDSNGGYDLYVSFSDDGSYFSEPRNLGPILNSRSDETYPTLAADGQTLYFSSNGYTGYGQSDMYISRRQDESWVNWSNPENMGPAINSPADDCSFSVDASGEFAYIASKEGATGESDIFRVSLPQSIRPNPVTVVFGRVLDAQNSSPIVTEVKGMELPKRTEASSTISSPQDGSFAVAIPTGKNYELNAKEKGYFALAEKLDLSTKKGFSKIERNIYLFPIRSGEPIKLGSRYFEPGGAELNANNLAELEKIAALLYENPGMKVAVDALYSKTLQKDRERSIAFYLYTQGLNPLQYLLKAKKK